MVPSHKWFVGFITLLHSVARNRDTIDQECDYIFLHHKNLTESQLTADEKRMVLTVVGSRRVRYHQIDSNRLAKWSAVPFLRDGATMAFVKLELFYFRTAMRIIFLDLDTLVLRPLGFVRDAVDAQLARSDRWGLHGSANFYGVAGWLFSAETTPKKPWYINTGFMAFDTPVPKQVLDGFDARVEQRTRERIRLYIADQDVVNHVMDAHPQLRHVHTDWHTNYRPNDKVALAQWRVAHWMGVPKPWGMLGHTTAPVRYNDRTMPALDRLWRAECERAVAAGAAGGVVIDGLVAECATQPSRPHPSALPDAVMLFGVVAVVGLVIMWKTRRACLQRFSWRVGGMLWAAVVGVFVLAVYLYANWDHAATVRVFLGLT